MSMTDDKNTSRLNGSHAPTDLETLERLCRQLICPADMLPAPYNTANSILHTTSLFIIITSISIKKCLTQINKQHCTLNTLAVFRRLC